MKEAREGANEEGGRSEEWKEKAQPRDENGGNGQERQSLTPRPQRCSLKRRMEDEEKKEEEEKRRKTRMKRSTRQVWQKIFTLATSSTWGALLHGNECGSTG